MPVCNNKTSLSGMLPEEIERFCGLTQRFRSDQIFKWISEGVFSFNGMSNLPIKERLHYMEEFNITSSKVQTVLKDTDSTVKLGVELFDKASVETVLLSDKNNRQTICLSCQAGCPLGCLFCKTGQLGFFRNLEPSEIVEQFLYSEKEAGSLENVVFMGMGEPMLNFEAVSKAIKILTHPKGKNFSKRRITISTAGVCAGIYKMADEGPDVRLAVSLTTANPKLRLQLMPVTKHNPLPELKKALVYFQKKRKKRITLEVALMKNVNTSKDEAQAIINFSKGLDTLINLIPWNPVDEIDFQTPSYTEINTFESLLAKSGLNTTIRMHRGKKIGGACGQLGRLPQSEILKINQ